MKKRILIVWLLSLSILSFSQEKGTFKDPRDGKEYKTVTIGAQTWMAENLAFKPDSGNYWAYDNKPKNLEKFGYLYDWSTAKFIAPEGWRLPTKEDWEILYKSLGGDGKAVYVAVNKGGSSGFEVLFGGIQADKSRELGETAGFWSDTPFMPNLSWFLRCDAKTGMSEILYSSFNNWGLSVRLIKNNE